VDVQDRVALDVGASTGGFTDCLLQHGTRFVYAVDVGYGQLAWKLRTHPQVLPIDKTNIRHLTLSRLKTEALGDSENFISIAVIDVSFISLRTVLPNVITLLTQQERGAERSYDVIALLKPQFEAGKAHVKKGGVVSDKQVHIQTIDNLSAFVTEKLGAVVMGITYSPIHKDIGNIEYLLWLTIDLDSQAHDPEDYLQSQQTTAEIVAKAHDAFES
jgi:23S rRNA (cytidine1920-2'-O)/16S rRNA (cytidine1409-2'-O)-methyltransferase